jgi:hypothetical protein
MRRTLKSQSNCAPCMSCCGSRSAAKPACIICLVMRCTWVLLSQMSNIADYLAVWWEGALMLIPCFSTLPSEACCGCNDQDFSLTHSRAQVAARLIQGIIQRGNMKAAERSAGILDRAGMQWPGIKVGALVSKDTIVPELSCLNRVVS